MTVGVARSIPLICACGQEAAEVTINGSRGIVNKTERRVDVRLEWTCLSGHPHLNWLPEDEADKLMRKLVGK